MPTPAPIPPAPLNDAANAPLEVNFEPSASKANKFKVSFEMDMPRFTGMVSAKAIEDTFKQQSQVYLTSAIGKMLEEPEFQEALRPKIKEHLISLPLVEIMSLTGRDIGGILELLS